jgi:hypothetical protein
LLGGDPTAAPVEAVVESSAVAPAWSAPAVVPTDPASPGGIEVGAAGSSTAVAEGRIPEDVAHPQARTPHTAATAIE